MGCVGYQYPNHAAEYRIGCLLIPILVPDSDIVPETCPNGWKNVFTEYGPYDPRSDLKESERNSHHDCYKRTWSKKWLNELFIDLLLWWY